MDGRDSARAIAIGRTALGVGLLVAPGLAGRVWVGAEARRPDVRLVMRAVGARDAALGVGALRALGAGGPARTWVQGGAAADAADFAGTLLARRALPLTGRVGVLCLAGLGAAAGARAAASLD